jgi:hypothetical protein
MTDALEGLHQAPRHLDQASRDLLSIEPQVLFRNIIRTIGDIDKPATPQKPPRSEQYLEQWRQYVSGKIVLLDKPALKYLCWESEVVQHSEFCRVLVNNAGTLSPRAIKGLVSTIHYNWHKTAHNDPVTYFTVKELFRYSGKDRTIAKWKEGSKILLENNAAASFAEKELVSDLNDIKIAADLWAINEDSAFMRFAVVNAFEQILGKIRITAVKNYIFHKLLNWDGWRINIDGFRHMISKLILAPEATTYHDELRSKILNHPMLGDPRLPANRNKWLNMKEEAKKQFIAWLSKEDIKFFFDNILKGHDPHGRRDFWLKYVDSMLQSRPFLSEATAFPLKSNRDINFGNLSGGQNKAAFVLDFGPLIAVEFSEIGYAYLYTRDEFTRYVPDLWTRVPVNESRLKNQGIPSERKIRHQAIAKIVYVDWRNDAASILSQHGIRKS